MQRIFLTYENVSTGYLIVVAFQLLALLLVFYSAFFSLLPLNTFSGSLAVYVCVCVLEHAAALVPRTTNTAQRRGGPTTTPARKVHLNAFLLCFPRDTQNNHTKNVFF